MQLRTFLENGTVQEMTYLLSEGDAFGVQELDKQAPDAYAYVGDAIRLELDAELASLYDTFRDAFFEDSEEYDQEITRLPMIVQEAGQNSACSIPAEVFADFLSNDKIREFPHLYRHLYLVDCQFLVGTIQNLLTGMEDAFISYFTQIVHIGNHVQLSASNVTMYETSQAVGCISSLLESYFIKAYSILDMLCKIGYELQFPERDFTAYKKLRSAKLLWGDRKKLRINHTVQTLFEQCDFVDMIEALRNEVIHSGTWELNPKVFIRLENGRICERFMLFPDMSQGHLATVKNRKHFFGSKTKVNQVLPQIHMAYQRRLFNTVKLLNAVNTE